MIKTEPNKKKSDAVEKKTMTKKGRKTLTREVVPRHRSTAFFPFCPLNQQDTYHKLPITLES